MHPMLNIAIRAARKAGDLILKHYGNTNFIEVIWKRNDSEFTTNVDRRAEYLIIEVIRHSYPKHLIIKESSDLLFKNKSNETQWIINPLDSKVNFIKCFPHFAVSIAVRVKERIEVAVVYDPIRNELFTASRGQGTQLNGYRLRGSNTHHLSEAIFSASFLFKNKKNSLSYPHVSLLKKILSQCADFRLTGCVSLDFAYVAAGRMDGLFEINLEPWAFSSGTLLVREAGGLVIDFNEGCNRPPLYGKNIVAGNPRIVREFILNLKSKKFNF